MKKEMLTLRHIALLSFIAILFSLATLIVGIFLWLRGDRKEPEQKVSMDVMVKTTDTTRELVTMMDNSKIWLNTGTELKYAPDYREERRARLTGQGYFKVKMQESLFMLETDAIQLFTRGATFLIDSHPERTQVRILLYAGNLKIQPGDGVQAFTMSAGTEFIWNRTTGESELHRIPSGVKGPEWIVYQFEYTTFDNILYSISQYYEVTVSNHRPDLNNEPFTFSFKGNSTLEEVMQILKTVSNRFTYSIGGNELFIN